MRSHPNPEAAARKLMRYFELLDTSRQLALAGLRHRHPNATDDQLHELWQERLKRSHAEKWNQHERTESDQY